MERDRNSETAAAEAAAIDRKIEDIDRQIDVLRGNSAEFNEFIPLDPDLESKLPPFPRGVLPDVIEAHAAAVAESLQVPFDMPAISDLSVLSSSVAGNFKVKPKNDWEEPMNVFAINIARPSERKSPVCKESTKPLYDFMKEENGRRKPEIAEYRAKKKILTGKIETTKNALTKGKNPNGYTEQDLIDLESELEALDEVNELELVLDDVTPEALTRALRRNNERIAIISAEGGIFGMLAGRYTSNPNLDLFLKGYSGEPYSSHRVGSGNISLEHPLLTMYLSVQPQVVKEAMENDEFRGRGFLARFLYSMPESPVGHRRYRTEPINPQVRQAYHDLIYRLLQLPYLGEGEERTIQFSPEADKLFEDFVNWVEGQLNDELEEIEDWGGKFCGQVARIAGLIHIGKCGDPHNTLVSAETMDGAIQIGKYFLAHSRRVFEMTGGADPPEVKDAKYIIKRLGLADKNDRNDRIASLSKREVLRAYQKFKSLDELEPGLKILMDYGYIRIEKQKKGGKGRPSEMIFINPVC
ncbi:MAG: DUF3987 domain-containing protein [Tannerellaceae bacterium]|nr:DUF3987 domain-containing protein [Tannerellaceae bacterium]